MLTSLQSNPSPLCFYVFALLMTFIFVGSGIETSILLLIVLLVVNDLNVNN